MASKELVHQRTKRAPTPLQRGVANEASSQPATPPSALQDAPTSPPPASAATHQRATRRSRAQITHEVDLPAVAPCKDLETLRHLTPDTTRHHVNSYLHSVMPAEQANDFEALTYRWELHLVELDHIQLLRQVEMNRRKLSRYRSALRKGAAFPPLVALGGDGTQPTEGVLLCDGYHRIVAMRDIGLHFAWVWLAVDLWREPTPATIAISTLSCTRA